MEGDGKHYQIYTATSGRNLDDYQRLVIAWRNGAPIRLGDVAEITDGLQDLRTLGLFNGRSEEHTSELQSLMRISYAVFCLKKKNHPHASSYDQTLMDTTEREASIHH